MQNGHQVEKIDPIPFFDWKALANASNLEEIEHNFGVYPNALKPIPDPQVIISAKNHSNKEEIIELQNSLEELGYSVLTPDNIGIYDSKLQNACLSFIIRYMNESITSDPTKVALWGELVYPMDNTHKDCNPLDILSAWDQNDDRALMEVLDLYNN